MKTKNGTIIKVIGFGAALIGFAATLISNWVDEQKMSNRNKKENCYETANYRGNENTRGLV